MWTKKLWFDYRTVLVLKIYIFTLRNRPFILLKRHSHVVPNKLPFRTEMDGTNHGIRTSVKMFRNVIMYFRTATCNICNP